MEKEIDLKESFDFYDQTYLKTYNLNKSIRYQLNLLDSLDMFTRKHSENVATVTCLIFSFCVILILEFLP